MQPSRLDVLTTSFHNGFTLNMPIERSVEPTFYEFLKPFIGRTVKLTEYEDVDGGTRIALSFVEVDPNEQ